MKADREAEFEIRALNDDESRLVEERASRKLERAGELDARLRSLAEENAGFLGEFEAELAIRPKNSPTVSIDGLRALPEEGFEGGWESEHIPITPILPVTLRRPYSGFDPTPGRDQNWFSLGGGTAPADLVDGGNGLIRKSCAVLSQDPTTIPDTRSQASLGAVVKSGGQAPSTFAAEFVWKLDMDYQFNVFSQAPLGSSISGSVRIWIEYFDLLGPASNPMRSGGAVDVQRISYSVAGSEFWKIPNSQNGVVYERVRPAAKTRSPIIFTAQPGKEYVLLLTLDVQFLAHNAGVWWQGTMSVD